MQNNKLAIAIGLAVNYHINADLSVPHWPCFVTGVFPQGDGSYKVNVGGFDTAGNAFAAQDVELVTGSYLAVPPFARLRDIETDTIPINQGNASKDKRAPLVIAATGPLNLIQTPLSQKLLPGHWLYTNLQVRPNAPVTLGSASGAALRVRLNVGCNATGGLEAAAFRGFEQADSVTEQPRLDRANSTSFVFDIEPVTINGIDTFRLSKTPALAAANMVNPHKYPIIHAVRIGNEFGMEELDAWTERTAAGIDQFVRDRINQG